MDFDQPATTTAVEENVGKKILAGGSWRVLAFAFASALGIVMIAVVSRELGPADFALFTTAMSLVTLAISLSDVGLLTLGIREYAGREPDDRDRAQRALITIRLVASVITSSAIVGYAILKDFPDDLVYGLIAAGFGVCALSLCISYTVPLQATYRLGQVAALEAGRQAVQMSLMIVLAITVSNVGWLMASFLPTGVILAVVASRMSRKLSPVLPSLDFHEMRALLSAVGAFALTAAIGSNYAFVAQIVSNSVLDAHDSGMFSLAFRIFVVAGAAFAAAAGGAFALFVTAVKEDDRVRLAYATRRLTQAAVLAGMGLLAGLVSGAGFVVALLGGAEFSDADPVVAVIALSLPASYAVVVLAMNLLADAHYMALVVRAACGAIVCIAATAWLSGEFGAIGAAWGIVIGEIVLVVAYASRVGVGRDDGGRLPEFRWLTGVLFAGVVACLPALLPLPSIINAALTGVVFGAMALVLRLIPPELLNPIRARLGISRG